MLSSTAGFEDGNVSSNEGSYILSLHKSDMEFQSSWSMQQTSQYAWITMIGK